MNRIVIVGASLAGLRAAETLRSAGFDGAVTVIGGEPHRPYDRPPLSKRLLAGEWEADRIQLRRPDTFDELDVEWRLGTTATGLALGDRSVLLDDDTAVGFDGVIIATGSTPRRLPGQEQHDNACVLRSLDDALAIRKVISPGGRRVIVVGAGFIGLEVAATAQQLGNDVVVLEAAPAPLIRGLGEAMGAAVGAIHRDRGVDLRCDVEFEALTGRGVQLRGEHVDADLVVVGIGVEPVTAWLDGSGLELRDGVVCDATLCAAPGVYAAGDVARWPNELFGEEMRVEHWTNAAEQGAAAASNLLAVARGDAPTPYAPVPFFWSDQFDQRLQFLGRSAPGDEVVVAAGSVADGKLLALYGRDGVVRGAFGLNAPRWVMPMRTHLLERSDLAVAVEHGQSLA